MTEIDRKLASIFMFYPCTDFTASLFSSSLCLVPTEKADNIPGQVTHEIVMTEPPYVLIKWNAPPAPNGLIILYEVFYRRVEEKEVSFKPTLVQ